MKNKKYFIAMLVMTLLFCLLTAESAFADLLDEAPADVNSAVTEASGDVNPAVTEASGNVNSAVTEAPDDVNPAVTEEPGEVNLTETEESEDCIPDEGQKLPVTAAAADIEKTDETADAREPAEDVPDYDAGKTEDAPEIAADAQSAEPAASDTAPAGISSDFEIPPGETNYAIKFSDGSGNTTYIKGAAKTAVSEILAGMGYELGEDAVIDYDPESVDTDVIEVSENEDGVLMLGNEKPFDRAARNLVLHVNGVTVELEITDDTYISEDTGEITGSNGSSPDAYLLDRDVKLSKAIVIISGYVKIDLCGHVLDASDIADALGQEGAIRVMNGATLNIVDSDPDANHAGDYDTLPDGGVIFGGRGFINANNKNNRMGGGILNEGTLDMNGGTVYMCSVEGDSNAAACGGGIANHYGLIHLENTVIDSCSATGGNINEGGGIWDDGFGTEITDEPKVNSFYTNVTIRKCSAKGSSARGGGLFWSGHGDADNAMLNYVTIEGCTSGNGGGIYCAQTSNMNSLTIRNCSASENGGGIFAANSDTKGDIHIADKTTVTIENCSASGNGGGLYSSGGSIKVSGVLSVTGCSTTSLNGQYLCFIGSVPACDDNVRGTITVTTGTGTAPSTANALEIVSASSEADLSSLLDPDCSDIARLTSGEGYTLTLSGGNKILLDKVKSEDAVAWIGSVGYKTIQGAVTAAADGDEIVITADTSENIQIATGKKITINLNGNVLTDKDETKPVITNSGELTVTGGKINGTSTGIANSSGGTVTVSVTVSGNNTAITGNATAIDNSGILNVSGGSVGSAGGNIGINNQGNGRTYIKGGQISANSYAIYNAQSAVVSVGGNNTTVHAADGTAIYNEGTLSVSEGDVYSGTGTGVVNKGTATLSGGSVTGNTGIMNSGTGTVTVNGTCVVNGSTAIINSGYLGSEYGLTIAGSAKVTGQDIGVKNTGDGNVNISGGIVSGTGNGAAGILNESEHDVKIDDGKILGTTGVKNTGSGNIQFTNGTVEGETAVENAGDGVVSISGGYFDGVRTSLRNSGNNGYFDISGGTFDRKSPASPIEVISGEIYIGNNVSEEYLNYIKNILGDDYVVTDTQYPGTGNINVVRTLAVVDGIKAGTVTDIKSLISTDGEYDIILKNNVDADATVAITGSKTVNLDLNGYVINGNNTDSVLSAGKDATLNVSNTGSAVSGGVYGGDAAAVEVNGGSVNINAGTFDSSNCAVIVNDGNLTVNSGLVSGAKAVQVNGGSAVTEGGTFYGALERNAGTLTVHAGNFDADPGNFVPDGYHIYYDGTFNMYRVSKNVPASDPVIVPEQGITVVVEPIAESALNEVQKSSVDTLVSAGGDLVAVLDVFLSGDKEMTHVNPEAGFYFKIDKANLKGHEASAVRVYLVKEDGTLVEVEFETDEDGNLIINYGKLGKYIIVYF